MSLSGGRERPRREREARSREAGDGSMSVARLADRFWIQKGQFPGFSAAMNGLITPGGTSKYMTYRLTTVLPSFRALWTCPWPMSTNDSPARRGSGAGLVIAVVVGERPLSDGHEGGSGVRMPTREPVRLDRDLLEDRLGRIVDLDELQLTADPSLDLDVELLGERPAGKDRPVDRKVIGPHGLDPPRTNSTRHVVTIAAARVSLVRATRWMIPSVLLLSDAASLSAGCAVPLESAPLSSRGCDRRRPSSRSVRPPRSASRGRRRTCRSHRRRPVRHTRSGCCRATTFGARLRPPNER